MSVKTTKSVAYLELHIKDLEKNTRDLKLKVSHFDLDSVNLEQDLEIVEKLEVKLKTLDQSLLTLDETLLVIKIVPEIKTEAEVLKTAIDMIKSPLHKVYVASSDLDAIMKPVLTAAAKLDVKIKALDREIKMTIEKLGKFNTLVDQTGQCITSIPAGDPGEKLNHEMVQASGEIDIRVKGADKLLIFLIDSIDQIKKQVEQIENRLKLLEEISSSMDQVISELNVIIVSSKVLENALSHIISIPYEGYTRYCRKWGIPYPCGWHTVHFRFSVEEIISGLRGMLKPIVDLLNKAMHIFLDPILKKLHFEVKLPSIKRLDSLNTTLQALQGNFIALPKEVDTLLNKAAQLEKEIDAIIEKRGQWQQMHETCKKIKQ